MKTYRLCSCWTPLTFTYAFPYKEWYCLNCWVASGFFNAGKEQESDKELQLMDDLAQAIFKRIYRDLQSPWCAYSNCKKCKEWKDRYHTAHLTKWEKEKDIIARKYLRKFVWVFR